MTTGQNDMIAFFPPQMLTYLMVARVAQLCPGAVLTKLDKLVEPLKMTVTTKVKANAVKQEYEKHDELKRSAMRAVAALMQIPGAGKGLFTRTTKTLSPNVARHQATTAGIGFNLVARRHATGFSLFV
jgi:hypothetical protein